MPSWKLTPVITICSDPNTRAFSNMLSTYSLVYGPSTYSSPSISVSSVMLGMMTWAFSHSFLMPAGKSGPKTGYSLPLSAITGST